VGNVRRRGLASLAWASVQDLFDQTTAFGRLALVHVVMMAGDTLVTVSLAGSLFFSVSPTEAKSKVLAYLLLTIAPFAVVSPILGPLIDHSANGRRILVALSASVRVLLCWSMSQHRGALVPEMARTDQFHEHATGVGHEGWPSEGVRQGRGFAGFNAQLTLLGTVSGIIAGSVGATLLKTVGATSVLIVAAAVFVVGTVASVRLQRPAKTVRDEVIMSPEERDLQALSPLGEGEVTWGLSASALMRFGVGFGSFLLAFGLRRDHAGLQWFAYALSASAVGSLLGLGFVTRMRNALAESSLLAVAVLATGLGAGIASRHPTLIDQTVLAGWLGLCAAVAQPSFDAITQRLVPTGAQGRTFARFAVRQQLAWVLGALIPVAISLNFGAGDQFLALVMVVGGVAYTVGRKVSHHGI